MDLFKDFNRKEKGDILTELYDKLCKFTHSTLFVTTLVEIKNNDDKEVLKMLNYQNFYFVKVLLFCCLKYFTNDKKHYLYKENMALSFLFNFFLVGIKLKNSKLTFEKYNNLLYLDDNVKFFDKYGEYLSKTKELFISLKNDIDNDSFLKALNEFFS